MEAQQSPKDTSATGKAEDVDGVTQQVMQTLGRMYTIDGAQIDELYRYVVNVHTALRSYTKMIDRRIAEGPRLTWAEIVAGLAVHLMRGGLSPELAGGIAAGAAWLTHIHEQYMPHHDVQVLQGTISDVMNELGVKEMGTMVVEPKDDGIKH